MYQSSQNLEMPPGLAILQLDPLKGMCHRDRTRTTTLNNTFNGAPGSKWGIRPSGLAHCSQGEHMTNNPILPLLLALTGMLLSPATELIIARTLPRLGSLPVLRVRITTAVVTALLFGLLAWRFGFTPQLPAFLLLALLGVQLSRIDFTLHMLPNALVLSLLCGGLLLLMGSAALSPGWSELLRALAGGAVLFAGYLILALISPRGLGMGDVKLSAPLGVYLGYLGWKQVLYGGLLGFVVGGVLTVLMLRLGRKEKPAETAHGPAMVIAALGVILALP